jgi:arylsulfatase
MTGLGQNVGPAFDTVSGRCYRSPGYRQVSENTPNTTTGDFYMADRPNIIVILVDDMGYSDIGCFGSEIRTPNLDRLGMNGLRFSQMYNSARCCPSRAALLTGLNPQQTGVGHMVDNWGPPAYQGYLNNNCVTVAEVLRDHGYATSMSGKWHVGGRYDLRNPASWDELVGNTGHPIPVQRGFDHFYGIVSGAANFFYPLTLMRDNKFLELEPSGYYFTDAITDNAVDMIQGNAGSDKPFFLHVTYTAPHWPLHALEEDIARYEGKYRGGWETLRTSRHEQLKGLGILDSKWEISPRDKDAQPWSDTPNQDWHDLRMAVYAAQIDRVDQGVGRILAKLQELGVEDNTLIMFMSDNGGCAEFLAEESNRPEPSQYSMPNADGSQVMVGNIPNLRPGPGTTFMSYDLAWANASNSPFRLFKRWTHEGGISTPLIVHWPDKIKQPAIVHEPTHITDIPATCIAAAGATYPTEFGGNPITPIEGQSFMQAIDSGEWTRPTPIFWEHEGSRAVRMGEWKLVSEVGGQWELYNMDQDRTELNNLAESNRTKADEMGKLYEEWAARCGVSPWPIPPHNWDPRMIGGHNHISG